MKTLIEMADEVFDRMPPDGHCREPYWTATEDELQRFAELVRAAEREQFSNECIDLVAMYGGPIDLEAAIRARSKK